ncbi:MAG: helix-turn-helix domain-containing protein [Lachnospiraceae bacterium]
MSFGDQLKKRREELGLSRSELADRLGVSRSAVGNYETGVSAPKEEVLCCGCSMPFMWSPTICIGMPTGAGERGSATRSGACWRSTDGWASPGARPSTPWRMRWGPCSRSCAGRRPGACAPCHPAVLLPGCGGLCRPGIRGGL